MDKNNQQIPGFGFDPGYEPSPVPLQPAPRNNSIFGVISNVNKGILKHPPSLTPKSEAEKELQSNIQQAKAVAQKLSNISPQDAKQRIFLNAKNAIENIQKGIWNPPASQANRPGISNTGFKVPATVSTQKTTVPINTVKGQNIGSKPGEGQKFNLPNQPVTLTVFQEEKKPDVFEERSKQGNNFTRKEALDEIDRYRGQSMRGNKDQVYEDVSKKNEPFKSDFDRYYFGNETQRNEISGKLHRTNTGASYNSGNDFNSKHLQTQSPRQGLSSERGYKSNTRLSEDYQAGLYQSGRSEHDTYRGDDSYQTHGTYGKYIDEDYQEGEEKYQRKPLMAEAEKGFETEKKDGRRNEYDPERWHYSGCGPNYDKSHDFKNVPSGNYAERWENKKPQNDADISYGNNYDPTLKDNKNRMTRNKDKDFNDRQLETQERCESGSKDSVERYSQSTKVFDYDHTTRSSNRGLDSYQTSRNEEHEGRFEDRFGPMNREMRGSGLDRGRDIGYRHRENDRHRQYEERGQHSYNEEERDMFYDDHYHRGSDERFDTRSDEHGHYGDDMANMEEFPEETEQSECKSQDGGMLYEDFLFGDDERDGDYRAVSRRDDGMGYRGRHGDSGNRAFSKRDDEDRAFSNREDNKKAFSRKEDDNRVFARREGNNRPFTRREDDSRAFRREDDNRAYSRREDEMGYRDRQSGSDNRALSRREDDNRAFSGREDDNRDYSRREYVNRAATRQEDNESRGRENDSDNIRIRNNDVRLKGKQYDDARSRGNSYDSLRSGGSDSREGRIKSSRRDDIGKESTERFHGKKDEHGFRRADRNLPITDDQKVQEIVSAVVAVPPAVSSEPMKMPQLRGVATHVPPPSVLVNQVPPPSVLGNQAPPSSGTGCQAPPPRGVPPPAVAVIPPPGIICNDCNVTCLNEVIYKEHMTSDTHILTLQRKAQELFHMESRPSRFDVDSSGKPLKASILPPTTMITGIPSNTLAKPSVGMQLGRNVFAGNPDVEIDTRQDVVSRYRTTSDSDVQVIPPKPLGPLETRSVQYTWLILHWRTRHEDEEALIDKYVVEYRNARETRWVRVGTTTKHEFEVNGLQEGTDYLFRVYTTNKDERSEYLESVLVTTKVRRDSSERSRRLAGRDRLRSGGRRSLREQVRRSSRERDRKIGRELGRNSGNRKSSGERKVSRDSDRSSTANKKGSSDKRRLTDKKSSRDGDNRDSRQGKNKDNKVKVEKEKSNNDNLPNTPTTSGENKDKQSVDEIIDVEKRPDVIDVDAEPEQPDQEEVDCLLYREIPNYSEEPLLGLDNIYEIRSYLPKTPPRYVCKLCNNKGSHKIIVKHIIGFPHKLNYFKKNNPEIFDVINVIALKKQQVERANYEARLEEDRIGRGSVRVMLMLNPEDNNGKTVYRDPIPVKAPSPVRSQEKGEVPDVYDVGFESQFDDLYNKAIETESISDTTLIGLDYIREMLHPRMEKEPKYTCSLCTVMCHKTTILSHILGKKHRTNYLRVYHDEVYEMIVSSSDQKHQLTQKIKEFAEKDGSGTIRTKVARNERMWRDKSSKHEEAQTQEDMETQEENVGNLEDPPQQQEVSERASEEEGRSGNGVQAIKFGIKKTEAPLTNVKPINVLDQELAIPKHKEAFDWTKENDLLQSRIHNETIIKCSRKSKFLTVYSEFFKRYPVIGIQWVTEFQKQDIKQEPWYMCSMCQLKLQWKSILDHVTSNLHRLNYMKKSDYRQMYNAVYHAIKKDKQSARPLIEQYSKEISGREGPPTQMEVMLELKINTEAFKSVAKIQENVKAHSTSISSSQSSSIQINIASTSLSSKKVSVEPTSVAVVRANDSKSLENTLSSPSGQNSFPSNTAPVLSYGSHVQQQYMSQPPQTVHTQPPQTVHTQVPSLVQQQTPLVVNQQVQPPPLQAPLIRPPPFRPPPSAAVTSLPYPPHNLQTGQAQGVTMATALPPQMQYQSATNVYVPPPSVTSVQKFAPPLRHNIPGQQVQQFGPAPPRQPLIPGPRPMYATNTAQRPPPLPYPPMRHIPPLRPSLSTPSSLVQQPPSFPVYSSTQTSFPNMPPLSSPSSFMPSTNLNSNQTSLTPSLIQQRPPPWQAQSTTGSIPPFIGSTSQYGSSFNNMATNNVPHVNISSGADNKNPSNSVETLDANVNKTDKHLTDDWQRSDKSNLTHDSKNVEEKMRDTKPYGNDFDVRDIKIEDSSDKERGVKRYSGESRYSDRSKRLRNEDRRNDLKTDRVESPRRSPSFGRSRDLDRRKNVGKDFDTTKDRNSDKGNIRDRRRSRSPYRSDRRSPPRNRQRDDKFGNRAKEFTTRSDRRPSPRRERDSYRRERLIDNLSEERRGQSFYRDEEQRSSEESYVPLDKDKVDDLIKRYSGREDEEYDNFMGKEADWDSFDDPKHVKERQGDIPDYETYGERYHNERQTYRNDFDNQENFEDNRREFDNNSWYRKNERSDTVYSGRSGMPSIENTGFRDEGNRYDEYSRQDSDMNRYNRGQTYRGNTYENRRDAPDVNLEDRNRDRIEMQENVDFRDEGKDVEEADFRHDEDWHYREDDRNPRYFRQDQNDKQNYNMGARHMDDTYDNRMSVNMEATGQRQSYGDDYGRMYDEPTVDEDLPDPSREEIEALLCRANPVSTPPIDNFNEYGDDGPVVQPVRQGSNTGYSRGNRGGRGGYRGRGGPRSGR